LRYFVKQLLNPIRLPVTRQQLDDMVFIRNEVNRLISLFKQQQHHNQRSGHVQPASSQPSRESSAKESPKEHRAGAVEEKIPSISPRRRLEEFMKSMQGVLSLLRPLVPLPLGVTLREAEAWEMDRQGAPVTNQRAALPSGDQPAATSEANRAGEAAAGVVPVGELIAELRGMFTPH
jgi:hypothetical protein